MAGQIRQSIVWALVRLQHGVISREQLLGLGFTRHAIEHRIRVGRLHLVHRGIYAVGRPELTQHGKWMAAVLACGQTAFLSHFSAAALWGLRSATAALEVSVLTGGQRRRPGITVHRRTGIVPVTHRGIPVTSVIDTLIDIAPSLSKFALEAAINEADKRDYADPEQLREQIAAAHPRRGTGVLARTLDRRTFLLNDSDLERYYVPCSDRAGLPRPLSQEQVNGARVDFYYPDLELVVETDGLRYHRTPAQQARDIVRDQQHFAGGLYPLRFTHEQIRYQPAYVTATLRRTAARLGYRPAA